jgi:hypothetical protein
VLRGACLLLILGFAALSDCNRDATEDPVIAAPPAGIAGGTGGVSFDLPVTAEHDETPLLPHPRPKRSPPAPIDPFTMEAPLLDPFADPPNASDHDGKPRPSPAPDPGMRRPRGTWL